MPTKMPDVLTPEQQALQDRLVLSASFWQRWLHKFVGLMRGEYNTCKTEQREGGWRQKIDYKTQETAAKSARKLTYAYGRPMDAYQCWFCGGWHIGNAANLTFGKFWSIMWVWLLGKKRTVRKSKMKPLTRITMSACDRCHKDTNVKIVSMFNTEEICLDCKDEEKKRPDYDAAVKAEEAAVRAGDFNFKGIGLK